jgi:hypothetical protein
MANDKNSEDGQEKKPITPQKKSPSKKTAKKPVAKTKRSVKKKASKKAAKKTSKRTIKKLTAEDVVKMMKVFEEDENLIEYKKTVRAVNSRVCEYLNSFIMIGYTEKGEPVQITSASTPQEYDALGTALQKYLFEVMPKGDDRGGPFM